MEAAGLFLSHSHEDKPFVRRLAKDLRDAGARVWLDAAEILVGDSLLNKMSQAIDETEYLGVALSRASVKSNWVRVEVEQAMNHEIRNRSVKVLPILVEDCEIPAFLNGKYYADFRTAENYPHALQQILRRL